MQESSLYVEVCNTWCILCIMIYNDLHKGKMSTSRILISLPYELWYTASEFKGVLQFKNEIKTCHAYYEVYIE